MNEWMIHPIIEWVIGLFRSRINICDSSSDFMEAHVLDEIACGCLLIYHVTFEAGLLPAGLDGISYLPAALEQPVFDG
jgi:hypothetical protein